MHHQHLFTMKFGSTTKSTSKVHASLLQSLVVLLSAGYLARALLVLLAVFPFLVLQCNASLFDLCWRTCTGVPIPHHMVT